MKNILKAAFVAATLVAGSAASAAVVVYTSTTTTPTPATSITTVDMNAGDFITVTEVLVPGDSAEFTFTALEALKVSNIALAGSGSNGGTDLANVEFGFTSATTQQFSTIIDFGGTAAGSATLGGFILGAGDSFTIYWEDGIIAPVGLTASFFTTAVPVPAALPMLAGGLALLGLARRKKA